LKVWFVLRTYGVQGLRSFIRKHVGLGEYFHDLLKGREDVFSVTTEPAFGLVTFQVKPKIENKAVSNSDLSNDFAPDAEAQYREAMNQRTKEVYEKINAAGEYFLTSTIICGTYVIRVVSATILSEEKYLKGVFDALVQAAEESG
jgi:aromatic-L-amino-acid decarboxylase